MTRETDFETRMEADATLMAILTGGVYVAGALGQGGINRTDTPTAFDSTTGYLKPCALVRQRALVADLQVNDQIAQVASATQVVEIYVYQDGPAYTSIDSALSRLFTLFFGHQFNDSFPAEWIGTLDRERDQGALNGASMARQEWLIANVIGD